MAIAGKIVAAHKIVYAASTTLIGAKCPIQDADEQNRQDNDPSRPYGVNRISPVHEKSP